MDTEGEEVEQAFGGLVSIVVVEEEVDGACGDKADIEAVAVLLASESVMFVLLSSCGGTEY